MFNSFATAEQLKDRDAFDKAQRAYVSYVRAYKEHQCSFIFQLKQLDYGALANQVATPFSRHFPARKMNQIVTFLPCSAVPAETASHARVEGAAPRCR